MEASNKATPAITEKCYLQQVQSANHLRRHFLCVQLEPLPSAPRRVELTLTQVNFMKFHHVLTDKYAIFSLKILKHPKSVSPNEWPTLLCSPKTGYAVTLSERTCTELSRLVLGNTPVITFFNHQEEDATTTCWLAEPRDQDHPLYDLTDGETTVYKRQKMPLAVIGLEMNTAAASSSLSESTASNMSDNLNKSLPRIATEPEITNARTHLLHFIYTKQLEELHILVENALQQGRHYFAVAGSSAQFLAKTLAAMKEEGWEVSNVDPISPTQEASGGNFFLVLRQDDDDNNAGKKEGKLLASL